jgi:hypothetical protein
MARGQPADRGLSSIDDFRSSKASYSAIGRIADYQIIKFIKK